MSGELCIVCMDRMQDAKLWSEMRFNEKATNDFPSRAYTQIHTYTDKGIPYEKINFKSDYVVVAAVVSDNQMLR